MMKKQFIVSLIISILTSFLFLSACQNSEVTPTKNEVILSATPKEVTNTPLPTVEEPTVTPKALFFITNTTENLPVVNIISDYLMDYSSSNGFVYQNHPSLVEITPQANDIVIVLETNSTQFDPAAIQPDVSYIVYTFNNQTLPPDVIQITQNPAEQSFLAGYISALIADDWRMGGILPNQSISNTSYEQIYKNGAHYLCGRCAPIYAPVVFFPVTAAVDSTTAVFDAYSQLESNRIFVLYIPNKFLTSELYKTLRENKRIIISDTLPNQETDQMADLYIYQDFISPLNEALLNINSPNITSLTTKLMIRDSENKLSQGKLNFIQEMINKLESGLLSPYSVSEN